MSLLVWCPLTGNLKNQGIASSLNCSSTNATVNTSGKIGSCYSLSGNGYFTISGADTIPSLNFTVCGWYYVNSFSSTFGFATCRNVIGKGIAIFNLAGKLRVDIGSTGAEISNIFPAAGQWFHLAVTYDGKNKKIYINGVLKNTTAQTSTSIDNISTQGWCIGASSLTLDGNGNYLSGRINDFRVYDECLSQKEIREISKGLVLHYPLNSPYNTSLTNLYQSYTATSYSSGVSGFTRTKHEDYTNYRIERIGTDSSYWANVSFPTYSWTVGKRYWISMKIKVNTIQNSILYIRHARMGNDWTTPVSVSLGSVNSEWVEISRSLVMPESFVRGGTTYTPSPKIEIYTSDLKTLDTGYIIDFDLKDICVYQYEGTKFPGYIDNSLSCSEVQDCSGFENNGTLSGTYPTITTPSPIYDSCFSFVKSTTRAIDTPNTIKPAEWTISSWVYYTSTPGESFIFGCWESGGIGLKTISGAFESECYGGGAWKSALGTTQIALNTWYHVVGTFDSSKKLSIYVNGVLENSLTCTAAITYHSTAPFSLTSNPSATSGGNSSMNGNISDLRLYTTSLSADDIKALYQCGASIDNLGSLHTAGEIKEGQGKISVGKNKVVDTELLQESDYYESKYLYTDDSSTSSIIDETSVVSFTPTTSNNSCGGLIGCFWFDESTSYTLEFDISFTGFETCGSTFAIRFRTYYYNGSTTVWTGSMGSIIGNKINLTTEAKAGSSKHVKVVFTPSAATVGRKEKVDIRSDYSNGTGKVVISNKKLYKSKYDATEKTRFLSDSTIVTEQINEN